MEEKEVRGVDPKRNVKLFNELEDLFKNALKNLKYIKSIKM